MLYCARMVLIIYIFMDLTWIIYNINNIGQKNVMRVIGFLQCILLGFLGYFQFIHTLVPEILKIFPFGLVLTTLQIEKHKKYIMYRKNNFNIYHYAIGIKSQAAHITSRFMIHDS